MKKRRGSSSAAHVVVPVRVAADDIAVDERGALPHGERPSGCIPTDEPEHGRPPVRWREDERVLEPRTKADETVDEASQESFPASDSPCWTPSKAS